MEEQQRGRREALVIGVGNAYRGDDAAGIVVARRVRELASPKVRVLEEEGEPTDLMESWADTTRVVLVDAVVSGAPAGTVHRFEPALRPLPVQLFRYSTHAFSVAEVIELARALDRLPTGLVLYGIEGRSFGAGAGLSPEIEAIVEEVALRVLAEIEPANA